MLIERHELVELLRARGNDHTAERAEQSLPRHIDLQRDRKALRQSGIDPNVLAFIISRQDRTTEATGPPLRRAADEDAADGSFLGAVGAPRPVQAQQQGPPQPGSRTALEPPNIVGPVSSPSSSASDQHVDQTTTGTATARKDGAGISVTPRPAIRCPRCQFAFGSTDLMLDHLKADHLDADGFTHKSLEDIGVTDKRVAAHLAVTRQTDAVPTDLEGAHRVPRGFRASRRLVIVVILTLLLIVWTVAILS